jgi:hypothetical protein
MVAVAMSKTSIVLKPAEVLYREALPYDDDIQRFQDADQLSALIIGSQSYNSLITRIHLAGTVAERSYLRGDWEVCAEWSRVTAELCVEYLTNHWREGIGEGNDASMADRAHGFVGLSPWEWQIFLERGLCWAAVSGSWKLIDSLMEFPRADLESREAADAARLFYAQLAQWWKAPARLPNANSLIELSDPKSAMYAALAEVACAIGAADQAAIADSLSRAIEAFLSDPNSVKEWPYAATFMWHLAERRGIYPAIAASHRKYLVILPEDPAGKHSDRLSRMRAMEPRAETPAARLNLVPALYRDWRRDAIGAYAKTVANASSAGAEAWFLWTFAESAANYSYLLGDFPACREWSGKVARAAIQHLFDAWPGRAKQARQTPNWVTELESGVGWSAIAGHWDDVERLLKFPNTELKPDLEGRAACAFHQGLARWWENDREVNWVAEVKTIRGAGSKTYHTLADIVAAISAEDSKAIQKAFSRHVEYFCKQRPHEQMFPIVASFLWNVARKRGLACELPENIANLLFAIPNET